MGGTALGFTADRMTAQKHADIVSRIESVGKNWGLVIPPRAILSYRNKESHGDIDFLFSGFVDDVREGLDKEFTLHESSYKNGSVTSYGIIEDDHVYQVDFICSPAESYDFSFNYFAWNDLGNLIGRIAHRIGLKFAHSGMYMVNRYKDNPSIKLGEHLLTNDFFAAIDYLDLDVDRFKQGFDNLEDIFEFVVRSKYFDYSSVDIERRNHVARIRDKKRSSYTAFIRWLKDNGLDTDRTDMRDKSEYREQHFIVWPHVRNQYELSQEKYRIELAIREKFNGSVVAGITKLSGKELGGFMSQCRESAWFENIHQMTAEEISAKIVITWINY